jgi:hypothetical protein
MKTQSSLILLMSDRSAADHATGLTDTGKETDAGRDHDHDRDLLIVGRSGGTIWIVDRTDIGLSTRIENTRRERLMSNLIMSRNAGITAGV